MEKHWQLAEYDQDAAQKLAAQLSLPPILAGILLRRGLQEPDEVLRFLHPETRQPFYDPFLMKDMTAAVERILAAVQNKERIIIYGDYDVDGITATTVMVRCLRRLGADVGYYIPNRLTEGYGFKAEALRKIKEGGASLLVSVDCGISAINEVAGMGRKLDIIITDHHLPGPSLPSAIAVVDPHRIDCSYPGTDLAGVGVAFKLCQALWQKLRQEEYTEDLELVALGTIADIVPLLDENRKLVKLGLQQLPHTAIIGLQALLEAAGLKGKDVVTPGQVGFVLAPRLNAAGRLAAAAQGAELFLIDDADRARAIAEQLDAENTQRRALEQDILSQAEQQLATVNIAKARVLVLAGEGWHPGVIGIVASRLVEKYYRPVVMISVTDGVGKGSCRSIKGFHMYEALTACQQLLLGFGGHAMAAGLSVAAGQIDALREALNAFAAQHLSAADYVPVLELAAELPPEEIDQQLMDDLQQLEPCGMGNPQPVFCCRHIVGRNAGAMGKDGQHLKFELPTGQHFLRAFSWNRSGYVPFIEQGVLDMAYVPVLNEWNGRCSIECKVQEFRSSQQRQDFPTRQMLGTVYKQLRQVQAIQGEIPADLCLTALQCGVSVYTLEQSLRIFTELGFLSRKDDGWILLPPPAKKRDLMESAIYRQGILKEKRSVSKK